MSCYFYFVLLPLGPEYVGMFVVFRPCNVEVCCM